MDATINGLMDGISVLEAEAKQDISCDYSDIMYNEQDPGFKTVY